MSTALAPPPWMEAAQAVAILNRSRVSTTNDSVSRCFGEEFGQRKVLGAVAAALEPRRHRRVDGRAPRPARWLATTVIYERVALCGLRIRWFGNPFSVPLYRCSGCGFVTTASLGNALRAHAVGSPDCASELELAADFSKAPEDASRLGRARPRNRSVSAETPADPPARSAGPDPPRRVAGVRDYAATRSLIGALARSSLTQAPTSSNARIRPRSDGMYAVK